MEKGLRCFLCISPASRVFPQSQRSAQRKYCRRNEKQRSWQDVGELARPEKICAKAHSANIDALKRASEILPFSYSGGRRRRHRRAVFRLGACLCSRKLREQPVEAVEVVLQPFFGVVVRVSENSDR